MERLRLGCKDFEERRKTYKLLAKVYVEGKKKENSFTQRELLCIAENLGGIRLTENTLRSYIKKERKNNP